MTREFFKIRVKNLTLREEPTVLSKILETLPRGEVIEKLGMNEKGDWVRTKWNGREGWLYKRCMKQDETPWLAVARRELGVQEIPGAADNPRVVEYLHATNNLDEATRSNDETAWCSAFVNWCMQQVGIEGTKHALARIWQGWGRHIDEPYVGCIAVFKREGGFGHVGFYLGETATKILLLGGNQMDPDTGIYQVSEKEYPKADLLEYRSLA
ncbi:MAG: TIGR02594 family protein [Chloroflexi bacterium]|nr:TIGR02594 family protein [Chloroflexota bacterium]